MSLQESGMLVHLSISQWSGRRFDRSASDALNKSYHADKNAARVNKLLVPKKLIAPVTNASMRARTFFLANTSPWLDNGTRVLNTKHYFKFLEGMAEHKDAFQQEVDILCTKYPLFVLTGASSFMGRLYNQADYPALSDIKTKFNYETTFTPIPANSDWRIQTDEMTQARLEAEMSKKLEETEKVIYQDAADRVYKKAKHIYDRLSANSKFKRNSFDACTALADLLPMLNVINDDRLNVLAEEMRALGSTDLTAIRKDDNYRSDVIDKTQEILKKMESYNYGTPRKAAES